MNKYYIHYVEGCTPKVASLKTKEAAEKFLKNFIKKHGGLDDKGDNWVDIDRIYFGERIDLSVDASLNHEEKTDVLLNYEESPSLMPLKIGDKVLISTELIKWYLKPETKKETFTPPSGKMNKEQKEGYARMKKVMTKLLKKNQPGEIVKHHYPNSESENFRVSILGYEANIEPKHLKPYKGNK